MMIVKNESTLYAIINYFLLIAVSIIWGAQFVFNKMALQYFSTGEIAFFRSFIGMITLSILLKLVPGKFNDYCKNYSNISFQLKTFMIGFFEATIPFLLVAWGQQYVDSAIASILIGTIPIFTVAIIICLPRESFTLGNILSVVIGFIAVVVLLFPGISQDNISVSILGASAILIGALSFAISLILIKKLPPISPILCARTILFWASIQILPIFLWQSNYTFSYVHLSGWLSMLFLGIFCGGIVYLFFVLLINRAGPAIASLSNYLVPFVGVGLGVIVFQEKISQYALVAMILIILALLVNEIFSTKRRVY